VHSPLGAVVPAVMFAQVPLVPPVSAAEHAMQVPVHVVLQQKSFAQWPLLHWPSMVHAVPSAPPSGVASLAASEPLSAPLLDPESAPLLDPESAPLLDPEESPDVASVPLLEPESEPPSLSPPSAACEWSWMPRIESQPAREKLATRSITETRITTNLSLEGRRDRGPPAFRCRHSCSAP
jgi:hypothetical protein